MNNNIPTNIKDRIMLIYEINEQECIVLVSLDNEQPLVVNMETGVSARCLDAWIVGAYIDFKIKNVNIIYCNDDFRKLVEECEDDMPDLCKALKGEH